MKTSLGLSISSVASIKRAERATKGLERELGSVQLIELGCHAQ